MGTVKTIAHAEHAATRDAVRAKDSRAVRLLGAASEVADQPPLVALSAATAALGVVLGRAAVTRAGLRMLAAHALATGAKTVLKNAIDRTRPAKAVAEGHRIGKGHGADDTDLNSFPSGHTAGAVAVAEAAARDLPGVATPARLAALAVAAVQMPRGKHYLSDVAVGAAIGWASERVVDRGARLATDLWTRYAAPDGSIRTPVLPARHAGAAPPARR